MARADVHGPAAVLPPRQWAFLSAGRMQLEEKLRLWLFMRAEVGLGQEMDLGLRWGLPTRGALYAGAQLKRRVLEGRRGALSAGGGVHYYERPALEGIVRGQVALGPVWLYGGLEANVELMETSSRIPLWTYAGLAVPISPSGEFIAELDLYRIGFRRSGLSLGIRFWL
jgi:hypothetical protein